jgi:hypothetical protein
MESFRKWTEHLDGTGIVDNTLRIITGTALLVWLFFHGMMYEMPYDYKLVELHLYPWWNILLVAGAAGAAIWCPRVGILAMFAVFLYLADMDALMNSEGEEFSGLLKEYFTGEIGKAKAMLQGLPFLNM